MKKIYFTTMFLFVCVLFGFSQTTIFENNFDSYSDGDKIAQTAGSPWTTWSNAPGGSEDGTISNVQSVSTDNSLHIVTNNDVVINLNDLTTGRYRFDFDFRVESGNFGYFNLLQDFAGSSSKWGMQVKFNTDLSGSVDAGGSGVASFTYSADNWMHIRMFVDLDNDLGTFLIDGTEIVSWKWSDGANGGNNLLKLDAVNLFGWNGAKGTAGYYVDNFVFSSLPDLTIVNNVTSVLDANSTGIDISWDEPTSIPNSYGIIRNNKVIVSGHNSTTYNDANLYPNTYEYKITAFYDELGYTPFSDASSPVTIAGGIARDLVLYEIGTGTNCGYCPGASMGAHDLLANGKNVAILKYQTYSSSDPYYNGIGLDRTGSSFYNFMYYPTTMTGGVYRIEGGSATESLYSAYLPQYEERISKPSLYSINMTVTDYGSNNYIASITVDEISDYLSNPVKLYTAVTESHIQYNWGNQTEVNNRCVGMYPTENGTPLDFTAKSVNTDIPFSITIDNTLTISDYELIVFVQEDNTKEVIQTIKFNMADAVVSLDKIENKKVFVYPNPAKDYIRISATANSKIDILDISGKIVISKTLEVENQKINIGNLDTGIYLIKTNSNNKVYYSKLIIE